METLVQDLRIAARTFARKPSFFVVAVATLAIGVGATTTIFSIVDGVLLTPLPYPEPDRIVRVGQVSTEPGRIYAMSYLDFKDLQARNGSFEALAAARGTRVTLLGRGEPEAQLGAFVSPEFFDVVGVAPALGRVFTRAEDEDSAAVVVIAHTLWERRFDADPSLVGRAVTLDGMPFTVVGVLPAGFRAPEALGQGGTQLWMPISTIDAESRAERRNSMLQGIGRLEAGVPLEGARAELELLGGQLREEFPRESGEHHFGLSPLFRQTVGSIATTLTVLLGAVGVLLLIACGNVANLLLVRASERGREFAVRAAIGAGPGRIVRQLLTESLLIGLAGGPAGIGVAWSGVRAFIALSPGDVPRLGEVALDGGVLGFAFAISVATSVVFGLAPAVSSARARANPAMDLKDGAKGVTASRRHERLRSGLVVAETSLALLLVIGAGLLVNSFIRLNQVDVGFDPDNVYAMSITHPEIDGADQLTVFYGEVLDEVAALPGVVAAGATAILPISGDSMGQRLAFEGRAPGDEGYPVTYQQVAGDYFQAIGIPLRRGRVFDVRDGAGSPLVAVINDAMAGDVFGDADPLGRRFSMGEDGLRDGVFEIVGVVGDARQASLVDAPAPELYLAYAQAPRRSMNIVVKTAAEDAGILRAMRERLWSVRDDLPVLRPVVMRQYLAGSVADTRFYTWLFVSFGVVALALALVGIYGTLAYAVAQRGREMGIRIALGASGRAVVTHILRQGMAPVVLGVGVGAAAAVPLTRVLESMVFGVTPSDPATLVVAVVAVLLTAFLTSLVPACRATKLDPISALRDE
ncbi:MAG: hypothetical protein CL471_07575 [Acidobacteria bacterium]|nr:hypothetical protein [Acidobacteriota bacterium]